MSDPELVETLRRTKQLFGALYPVLVDPEGKVIDGKHRLAADPDWPKVTVDWLTNPIDALILRVVSNVARRDVSAEEKSAMLAEIAEKTGWSAKQIAEALGMSYRWVVKYLPEDHKREYARRAEAAPPTTAEEKPEEEKPMEQQLDEAERKEAERMLGKPQAEQKPRVRTMQEAAEELGIHLPEPSKAKAPSGKCPFCGQSVNADHLNLVAEGFVLGEPELTVKQLIMRSRK